MLNETIPESIPYFTKDSMIDTHENKPGDAISDTGADEFIYCSTHSEALFWCKNLNDAFRAGALFEQRRLSALNKNKEN